MAEEKQIEIKISNPRDIRRAVNDCKAKYAITGDTSHLSSDPKQGHSKLTIDFLESEIPCHRLCRGRLTGLESHRLSRGRLAGLESRLQLSPGVSEEDKIIQAVDLATLINQAPGGLWKIVLNDVQVGGDFAPVLQAISSSKTLWCFYFTRGQFCSSTDDMMALGETLAKRSASRYLLDLSLNCYRGHEQAAWDILAPVIQQNSMNSLQVVNFMDQGAGFRDALQALAANCTKLTRLRLGYDDNSDYLSSQAIEEVARLAVKMNWLKTLGVGLRGGASAAALAKALHHHKGLQRLEINSYSADRWKEEDLEAFHELVKTHNFNLELKLKLSFWGFVAPPSPKAQELLDGIKFYSSLNKLGRAKLLAPGDTILATTEEWMKAIADQDDISVIFYFLQKNPALCLPDPTYRCETPAAVAKEAEDVAADGSGEDDTSKEVEKPKDEPTEAGGATGKRRADNEPAEERGAKAARLGPVVQPLPSLPRALDFVAGLAVGCFVGYMAGAGKDRATFSLGNK